MVTETGGLPAPGRTNPMMARTALALATLAAVALPDTATAASLGTIPVDPNGGVTGSFSAPGTQTWRLYLKAGKDYAVRAAGGRVLAGFTLQVYDSDGPLGASFRAPYTGSYTVVVTAGAEDF